MGNVDYYDGKRGNAEPGIEGDGQFIGGSSRPRRFTDVREPAAG